MQSSKATKYQEQKFGHLKGLDGLSNAQIAEHVALYAGYVRQVTRHQDGIPAAFKPLLVMDVWEHAFMRDYTASERGRYIEAFFRNVDWTMVDRRLHERAAVRPAAAA